MKKLPLAFTGIILSLSLFGCEEQRKGEFLEQGITYFEQDKYKEAELKIKSAIQEDPSLSTPFYYMALLNEKGKKYKAMRTNLIEAVKLDPENTDAKLKLSKVLLLFNETEKALQQLATILAKTPEKAEALAIKASIFMRQNKNPEALVIIDSILKNNPEHIETISLKAVMLIKQKAFDKALALLSPAIEKNSENISLHLLKIQIDSLKSDLDAVIADYEKLAILKPKNIQVKFTLAKVYKKANKPEKAENILTELVNSNPNLINLNIALLDFIYESDQDRALTKFDSFINQYKDNHEKIIPLSQWLISRDKISKAQQTLIAAAENNNISNTNKAPLNLLLAKVAFNKNNTAAAFTYLDKILLNNTEDNNAKVLKSEVQMSLNQYPEARKLLEEVLWQQPNMDSALSLLGKINEIEGALDKASLNFESALKINPSNLLALDYIVNKEVSESHSDYAVEILERALTRLPSNLKILTQLVELNFNANNFDTAKKYITRIKLQKNGTFLADYLTANALQRQNKLNEAVTAYKTLLEKAPWLNDALTGLTESYLKLNQKEKIITYLNKNISEGSTNSFVVILKSRLLITDKKYKQAAELLSQSLDQQQVKSTTYHVELGKLYNLMGKSSEERNIYLKGLEINPKNIPLMLNLASNLEKNKTYEQARKLYEQVLSINPGHNISKNNLATLLLDHYGKPEDIDKALHIIKSFKQSKHPYFLDTYGWAKLKSGAKQEALSILKQVTLIAPNTPVFRYHLAVIYNSLGDTMSAVSELKQALYIGKGSNFAEKVLIEELLVKLKSN